MSTKKLYDIDAYQTSFEAKVVSCEKQEKGYAVILDQTLFFPEFLASYKAASAFLKSVSKSVSSKTAKPMLDCINPDFSGSSVKTGVLFSNSKSCSQRILAIFFASKTPQHIGRTEYFLNADRNFF